MIRYFTKCILKQYTYKLLSLITNKPKLEKQSGKIDKLFILVVNTCVCTVIIALCLFQHRINKDSEHVKHLTRQIRSTMILKENQPRPKSTIIFKEKPQQKFMDTNVPIESLYKNPFIDNDFFYKCQEYQDQYSVDKSLQELRAAQLFFQSKCKTKVADIEVQEEDPFVKKKLDEINKTVKDIEKEYEYDNIYNSINFMTTLKTKAHKKVDEVQVDISSKKYLEEMNETINMIQKEDYHGSIKEKLLLMQPWSTDMGMLNELPASQVNKKFNDTLQSPYTIDEKKLFGKNDHEKIVKFLEKHYKNLHKKKDLLSDVAIQPLLYLYARTKKQKSHTVGEKDKIVAKIGFDQKPFITNLKQ